MNKKNLIIAIILIVLFLIVGANHSSVLDYWKYEIGLSYDSYLKFIGTFFIITILFFLLSIKKISGLLNKLSLKIGKKKFNISLIIISFFVLFNIFYNSSNTGDDYNFNYTRPESVEDKLDRYISNNKMFHGVLTKQKTFYQNNVSVFNVVVCYGKNEYECQNESIIFTTEDNGDSWTIEFN